MHHSGSEPLPVFLFVYDGGEGLFLEDAGDDVSAHCLSQALLVLSSPDTNNTKASSDARQRQRVSTAGAASGGVGVRGETMNGGEGVKKNGGTDEETS